MKKQIMIITTLVALMCICMTACSNKISKSTIMEDIEPELSKILSDDESIDDIDILEYNTDDKKDTSIYLEVKSSDKVAENINYFMVTYYSADGKWIFDTVSQVDKNKSTSTPKKGVNDNIITSSLVDESVEINGECWEINSDNIKDLSIQTQKTDLDKKEDKITIKLTLDDDVLEAEGKLSINYVYNKKWELKSISKEGEFKVSEKKECALEITDADLINEIAKTEVNLFENTSNSQTITMNKSQISDFEVYKEDSTNKGTYKRYYCKGKLTKPNAVIKFDTVINYVYEDSWYVQPLDITAQLDSIDIKGKWNGTYNGAPYDGESSLEITKVSDDGKVEGVYSYTPEKIDEFSHAGSYKVSGTIDMNSLIMNLEAGDWVVEDPSALSISKVDITACIYVDEAEIEGLGQEGDPFVLKRDK